MRKWNNYNFPAAHSPTQMAEVKTKVEYSKFDDEDVEDDFSEINEEYIRGRPEKLDCDGCRPNWILWIQQLGWNAKSLSTNNSIAEEEGEHPEVSDVYVVLPNYPKDFAEWRHGNTDDTFQIKVFSCLAPTILTTLIATIVCLVTAIYEFVN